YLYFSCRRHLFSCPVVLLLLWCGTAQAQTAYGNRVVVPETKGRVLSAAVEDMTGALNHMTGASWQAADEPAENAIILALSDSPQAPADARQKLRKLGPEAFLIRWQNAAKLWFVANDERGLSHGIYYYLEQLGCRWCFPTAKWTIIPKRPNGALKID